MKKHGAALLVVEQLGAEEIIVDTLRLAVYSAHQLLTFPYSFLFLHGVPHYRCHTGTVLSFGVVGKMDDCDTITSRVPAKHEAER